MKFFWKYIFPVIFGLIIYTSVRLVNDTTAQDKFWERPWQTTAIELATVIAVSYLLHYMLHYFIRKFGKDKARQINSRTILREFGIVYLWLFIVVNLTIIPMAALTDDGLGLNDFVIINIIPALYILLYFAIVRGNHYLKAYVDQKLQLEKITNDHLQTELKFLRAQYHPHFLFNALNTIYFQMDENIPDAKRSIEKFSELLRYQLYDQQQTVPISQEINYLQNFIDLQKIRSSEKLQLQVNFDEDLNGQQVYPLLFLPLVENAFKYVGGEYRLSISARQTGTTIELKVANSIPAQIPVKNAKGIGLENLQRRLELLYPQKHELVVAKKDDNFLVTLRIETN